MKFLNTLLLGLLTLTTGTLARRDLTEHHGDDKVESSAKCFAVAIGYSKASNDDIIAKAAADASEYICHGKGSDADIAHDVAKGFALAVAHASAKCELTGDAKAWVNAKAYAKAEAELWVTAFAKAVADASTCQPCDAYAKSVGYIKKHVFLEAVAHASVTLDLYTTASSPIVLIAHVQSYMKDIEVVIASAFAKALAGAAEFKKKDGCLAWVNAGGCIWTEDHGDQCFECEAKAIGYGEIENGKAFAGAVAKAAAWTCGKKAVAIAEAEATAEAIAEATAVAIAAVWGQCEHDGNGKACAKADAAIEETARAVAYAFARAWAGAITCEGCYVNVDAVAKAVGDILVTASANAWGKVCVSWGSDGFDQVHDVIKSGSVTAVAKALAGAIAIGDHKCIAAGYVEASVSR